MKNEIRRAKRGRMWGETGLLPGKKMKKPEGGDPENSSREYFGMRGFPPNKPADPPYPYTKYKHAAPKDGGNHAGQRIDKRRFLIMAHNKDLEQKQNAETGEFSENLLNDDALERVSGGENDIYLCPHCGKDFHDFNTLEQHKRHCIRSTLIDTYSPPSLPTE